MFVGTRTAARFGSGKFALLDLLAMTHPFSLLTTKGSDYIIGITMRLSVQSIDFSRRFPRSSVSKLTVQCL